MNDHAQNASSMLRTLWVLRLFWAVLIVGQLCFGVVAVLAARQASANAQTHLRFHMLAIAVGVLVGAIGMGYFVRNQFYKKNWHEHFVLPQGYFMGNFILFLMLEGASMVTFVFVIMSGQLFPMVLPAVASLGIQCANFPTGMPMRSSPPGFAQDPT